MSAIENALKKQSAEVVKKLSNVTALTVAFENKNLVIATSDSEISFLGVSLEGQTFEIPFGDDDDEVRLVSLSSIGSNALLGANYCSARQYSIEGDELVETCKWDLLSKKSTANSVFVASAKNGLVKIASACDYLHVLHDDGTTSFVHEEENYFWGLAVSANGDFVGCGRRDGSIEMRRASDLTLVKTFAGLNTISLAISFSPDGKYLAASDDSAQLIVWNLETGEASQIPGWTKIIDIFWFSDSSGFVSVSLSRIIYLHDLRSLSQEPAFVQIDESSPLYVQKAVLCDDSNLFVFVEKKGIVRVRLGE